MHVRPNKRRLLISIFALAMVPLLAGSAAYACQRLVTLHANPSSAAAGAVVKVRGQNYTNDPKASNVDIRLDRRSGPVLASVAPAGLGPSGSFELDVTIPSGTAIGDHILIATQTLASGAPCVGCPGRANLTVTAAQGASASSNGAAAGPSPAQESSEPAPAPASGAEPAQTQPASEPATASQATATGSPAGAPPASNDTATVAATSSASPAATPPAAGVADVPAGGQAPPAPATGVDVAPAPSQPAGSYDAGSAVSMTPSTPTPSAPAASLLPAPASGQRPSLVPGLTMVAGLALVLLSLAAFWKTDRTALGTRRLFSPAG